ncbi:helix-turn-helix domain-containing protein [Wukongibacter sp. M2B1]|uniref:helix-turn-helix domain-containing protein n=1 Tax=Wukongibacter sp. M2B1 TaxID=3088895 RepID=UPI003D794C18
MTFQRVKDLRTDLDIKQKEIASYLGIDQSTYSDYETGKLNIPIDAFIKLSKYYNTSIDYLVGITNEKRPYPRAK